MAEYKKGDWVRLSTEKPRYGARYVSTPVKVVKRTNDYLVEAYYPVEGIFQNIHTGDLEPWQPRVGERVRAPATTNTEWVGEGEVTRITDICIIVKMLSGKNKGNLGGFYHGKLEPITDALPVAEQPAALKIQAGKFYKTRDGRKVGPMKPFLSDRLIVKNGDGNIWMLDGKAGAGNVDKHDLIAEWVDTPVRDITAATVDAINDEYGPVVREVTVAPQQARFKAGDRVKAKKSMMDVTAGQTYEVVEVDPEDEAAPVRIVDDAGDLWWLTVRDFEIVAPATPAIVCKIENGQPLPASRPHVHTSAEAADAEARRLASSLKGQEFGVFVLTGATHKEAKVYEHEWQRLAAEGEKIRAIKSLRNMAALDLVTAKRAVEVFIDKAA